MIVERITVSTALDVYLGVKVLAGYSGLSDRTLRGLIADPLRPLPHHRVGGKDAGSGAALALEVAV